MKAAAMTLARFDASYPVFGFQARITYHTPRRSTAFERMVLRLVQRAHDAKILAGASLLDVFKGTLGVTDAHILLEPTVAELIALDVLSAPKHDDMLHAPICQWTLTAIGREFAQQGMLPGRPRYESLRYQFEPLSDALVLLGDETKPGPSASSTAPQPIHVDHGFPDIDLAPRVQSSLPNERHRWLEPDTKITAIEVTPDIDLTRWLQTELVVDCTSDGRISIQAPDSTTMTRWLHRAVPEEVWDRLIGPALGFSPYVKDEGSDQEFPEDLPTLSLEMASAISAWQAPSTLRDIKTTVKNSPAGLVLLPDGLLGDAALAAQSLDVVRFAPHPAKCTSTVQRGIALDLPPLPGLPLGWTSMQIARSGAAPLVRVAGWATLHWAGQPRTVAVRMQLDSAASELAWESASAAMSAALSTPEMNAYLPLAIWFEPPRAVLERWLIAAVGLTPEAWLRDLGLLVAAMNQRWSGGDSLEAKVWEQRILPCAQRSLEQANPLLDLDKALSLIGASSCIRYRRERFILHLLGHMAAVDTMGDILKLRAALKELPAVVFPANLLGHTLRLDLLKAAMQDTASRVGHHALSDPFRSFGQVFMRTRSSIAPVLMDQSRALTTEWLRAARTQPGQLIDAVRELVQAIDDLPLGSGGEESPAGNFLQGLRTRLQVIRTWIEEALAGPLAHGRRAIVLDTSSLIAMPGLLSRMPSSDVPVIPQRVLEELDGLKTGRAHDGPEGEARARSARQAIAAIEAASDGILFEPSRRHQCAQDWPSSPDNEILSVAVFHALNDVVLVSADRNLRNKAAAEKLQTIDTAQYLSAGNPSRSAPSKHQSQTKRHAPS